MIIDSDCSGMPDLPATADVRHSDPGVKELRNRSKPIDLRVRPFSRQRLFELVPSWEFDDDSSGQFRANKAENSA
jgi:hypothetical protein